MAIHVHFHRSKTKDQLYEHGYRSHEIVPLGEGRYTVRGPMLQGGVFHSKGEAQNRIDHYMGHSEITPGDQSRRLNVIQRPRPRQRRHDEEQPPIKGEAFRRIGGFVRLTWATPQGGGEEEAKSGYLPGSFWSVKCSQHGTVATGLLQDMEKRGEEHAALHEAPLKM